MLAAPGYGSAQLSRSARRAGERLPPPQGNVALRDGEYRNRPPARYALPGFGRLQIAAGCSAQPADRARGFLLRLYRPHTAVDQNRQVSSEIEGRGLRSSSP